MRVLLLRGEVAISHKQRATSSRIQKYDVRQRIVGRYASQRIGHRSSPNGNLEKHGEIDVRPRSLRLLSCASLDFGQWPASNASNASNAY